MSKLTSYATRADMIFADVLAAMQPADELGGCEGREYVELMERIAATATERARVAVEAGNAPIERLTLWGSVFEHISTGGGCEALACRDSNGAYVMITANDGAELPTADDWCVGVYNPNGEQMMYTWNGAKRWECDAEPFARPLSETQRYAVTDALDAPGHVLNTECLDVGEAGDLTAAGIVYDDGKGRDCLTLLGRNVARLLNVEDAMRARGEA